MRTLTNGLMSLAPAIAPPGTGGDAQMAKFLADYTGLYARESLPRWCGLFRADATVARSNADGSVTTWNAGAFCELQRGRFESGKPIVEVLENTHAQRTGSLASVRSDFVWTDGEITQRGRLVLLLIEEHGTLRIQGLAFSYSP